MSSSTQYEAPAHTHVKQWVLASNFHDMQNLRWHKCMYEQALQSLPIR